MLVGHQEVARELSLRLPPVSVINGPQSVGKRLIAAYAAIKNSISRVDFIEIKRLTVQDAKRIKDFVMTAPHSNYKFILIDLDQASRPAMDDLLKTLEEPPEFARFSLITSSRVLPTLATRAHKYSVGLLSPDELKTILTSKGISAEYADKYCHLGRVDLAISAVEKSFYTSTIITVLQAVEAGDYELFNQAFKGMDDHMALLLVETLKESVSKSWRLIKPEYIGAFSTTRAALTVLTAWSNVQDAKPTLAVRTALESVMR